MVPHWWPAGRADLFGVSVATIDCGGILDMLTSTPTCMLVCACSSQCLSPAARAVSVRSILTIDVTKVNSRLGWTAPRIGVSTFLVDVHRYFVLLRVDKRELERQWFYRCADTLQ